MCVGRGGVERERDRQTDRQNTCICRRTRGSSAGMGAGGVRSLQGHSPVAAGDTHAGWRLPVSTHARAWASVSMRVCMRARVRACACACEFVGQLACRPAEQVGERGIQLSGGQQARIALARLLFLLGDTVAGGLCLLDSPLAALDTQTARRVYRGAVVAGLLQRGCAVVVASAPEWLHAEADAVVWMGGRGGRATVVSAAGERKEDRARAQTRPDARTCMRTHARVLTYTPGTHTHTYPCPPHIKWLGRHAQV